MADSKTWLVHLAIGPVGSFIVGGRRSRDLWYGSRLLSELTVRAAQALQAETGVDLWVPTLDRLKTLKQKYNKAWAAVARQETNGNPNGDDAWTVYQGPTVTNKVYAVVTATDGAKVAEMLRKVEQNVRDFVTGQVNHLLKNDKWKPLLDEDAVRRQIEAVRTGDFVEFYGVWTPMTMGHASSEKDAYAKAERLMAMRKNGRVFPAPTWTEEGRWKSSLDRGWGAVTTEVSKRDMSVPLYEKHLQFRALAGVGAEERLGLIDALRREAVFRYAHAQNNNVELPKLPFPPLARVVADPWIEGVAAKKTEVLHSVRVELDALIKKQNGGRVLSLFSSLCREPGKQFGDSATVFPYDPSLFFEGGLEALQKEITERQKAFSNKVMSADAMEAKEVLDKAAEVLTRLHTPVSNIVETCARPLPYYALVEADGDGIGNMLAAADSKDRNVLVTQLYRFADEAWELIDRRLHGCAFYVGGDELSFYCAADRALEAVDCLKEKFMETAGKISVGGIHPTLSFGVVIAHVKQDLRQVREAARDALAEAKQKRRAGNGNKEQSFLCIYEQPRSGARRFVVDPTDDLKKRLEQWQKFLEVGDVSMGTAEDLLLMYERFGQSGQADGADGIGLAQALPIQKRKRSERPDVPEITERAMRLRKWADVPPLAAEIRIAERLRRIADQRKGLTVGQQGEGA